MWLFAIIAFIIEVVLSCTAHLLNIAVINQKPQHAALWSLLTTAGNRFCLVLMGSLSHWNTYVIIASFLGDSVGDVLSSWSKYQVWINKLATRLFDLVRPKKRTYVKKLPFTSA